jgi:beta-lactamase regulating signal transducer with metallopeptidase domain
MTITEICLLAWAIFAIIVVAILLRVSERGDDPGRENRK